LIASQGGIAMRINLKALLTTALIAILALPITHAPARGSGDEGPYRARQETGFAGCGSFAPSGDANYRPGWTGYAGYEGYGTHHPGYAWGPAGWTVICD
jgi:hypothetical protein